MPQRSAGNPNSLACLACRSKHLKCDARQPTCDRCAVNKVECIYIRSRRGFVGGRRRQHDSYSGSSRQPTDQSRSQISSNGVTHDAPRTGSVGLSTPASEDTIDIDAQITGDLADDRLIDIFYQHVYPAHPFVIPRKLHKRDPNILPQYLKRAIHFITRPLVPTCTQHNDTFDDIFNACTPRDGFQVQALLLLTIGSYARGERADGDRAIGQAIETSYSIGLNCNSFGSGQCPVLQESWQRTWWELYSVAGVIRVLTPTVPKLDTFYNRLMPGHDIAYDSCRTSDLRTLGQMQERHFADDNFHYSSFAYRIEAVRILNETLESAKQDCQVLQSPTAFHTFRASIRSFLLSLPLSRQSAVQSNGETDELMFCALTIIHLASILLNLPRSGLPNAGNFATICSTGRLQVLDQGEKTATFTALGAADTILQLLIDRHSESMKSVSPCFSCVLAFAATTHLSAFCLGQDAERMRSLREYLQVSLGALDTMGQTWPIAKAVRGQLAEFARGILTTSQSSHDEDSAHVQIQGPLEDVTDILSLELVPGMQDDMWLHDLVNNDMGFSFA